MQALGGPKLGDWGMNDSTKLHGSGYDSLKDIDTLGSG